LSPRTSAAQQNEEVKGAKLGNMPLKLMYSTVEKTGSFGCGMRVPSADAALGRPQEFFERGKNIFFPRWFSKMTYFKNNNCTGITKES